MAAVQHKAAFIQEEMGQDAEDVQKGNKRSLEKEVKEEGREEMGSRWRVKEKEMIVYAPVALLGSQ